MLLTINPVHGDDAAGRDGLHLPHSVLTGIRCAKGMRAGRLLLVDFLGLGGGRATES